MHPQAYAWGYIPLPAQAGWLRASVSGGGASHPSRSPLGATTGKDGTTMFWRIEAEAWSFVNSGVGRVLAQVIEKIGDYFYGGVCREFVWDWVS